MHVDNVVEHRCPSTMRAAAVLVPAPPPPHAVRAAVPVNTTRTMRSCAAFVGTDVPLAAAYHCQDYDYDEHAAACAPMVEAQWAQAPAHVRAAAARCPRTDQPLSAVAEMLQNLSQRQLQVQQPLQALQGEAGCWQPPADASSVQVLPQTMPPPLPQQQQQQQHLSSSSSCGGAGSDGDGDAWEVFYRAHPSARFYKERRYLLLEFPCLAPPSTLRHLVEIGAGCGSSALPVLRSHPGSRATLCDVSATCLAQLEGAMHALALDRARAELLVADGTNPALGAALAHCAADAALIMFTLSAVPPTGMLAMLRNAAASLAPGGHVCVRDHALYDMVQLRCPPQQLVARHTYRRGDDTLAYFFSVDDLAGLAEAAGLQVIECDVVRVTNRNRKTGQVLRRAFVHGLFRKPLQQ